MSNQSDNNQIKHHYNREERLAMMPSGALRNKKKPKGFFRNNKSFTILFINFIVICLLFLGFFIYTIITSNKSSNSDFTFLLNGYIYDSNILISLTIEKKHNSKIISDTPLPFEVTITLSDNKEFYKKFFDNLPVNSGKEIVLRTTYPASNYEVNKNSLIYANIKYTDKEITLKSKIKNEK